ncbi:potassium channel family protein [Kribbella soli]|uniref:Two pore domain potassium channel family protein n=1 Tax=Kribbella soli TaxID=1124743 RepID=A0A4R0HC57_9ACTN|nr:potassium channel family protein [Kribbella soli]TCC07793.1 two pore domain potassium channel family protein [Kribbella soli]
MTEAVQTAEIDYHQLPKQTRRRLATMSLLRSLFVSVVIVVGYFLLPMRLDGGVAIAALGGGLAVVGLLLARQILDISRSPYPRIRAIGALATSVPLFLTVFSTSYFLMARAQPANFSEQLSRLDAAYFTVTVFATVGFGDITAESAAARAVVTVQMLGDLVMVGLVARTLVGAVQHNLSHRGE